VTIQQFDWISHPLAALSMGIQLSPDALSSALLATDLRLAPNIEFTSKCQQPTSNLNWLLRSSSEVS